MRSAALTPLLLALTACGSALVGPAAPSPDSPAVFGYYESGAVIEGWVLVTDDRIGCDRMLEVLDRTHRAGDSVWIALEKGPDLDWEGLYPGTYSTTLDPEIDGGRHAEVYFQQGQDIAVLTGNDVWVWVDGYGDGLLRLVLQTERAEGIVVARDCGEIQ